MQAFKQNQFNKSEAGFSRLFDLEDKLKMKQQDMKAERLIINKRCDKLTKVFTSFNLFQTPDKIAAQMCGLLGETLNKTVLEPSAGLGRILKHIDSQHITALEKDPDCAAHVFNNFPSVNLICKDFMEYDAASFDKIVMNPPFKRGLDIKHIKHAYSLLNKGGLLVALCYNGVKQNKNLKPLVDTWDTLPAKSFKESGTNAEIVLLTWAK